MSCGLVAVGAAGDSRVYHMVRCPSKNASALNANGGGTSELHEKAMPAQVS